MDAGLFKLVTLIVLVVVGYFQGRKNEREHLAELARREQELRDVLIFTTRYPPLDRGSLDPYLVTGAAVVAADHFKTLVAGLRKFAGGRFNAYEVLVQRARREALLRMKEHARDKGCGMIFNVRIESTRITSGKEGNALAVEALAYGTAFAPAVGTVEESRLHYTPRIEFFCPEVVPPGFDLFSDRVIRATLVVWLLLAGWGLIEAAGSMDYWYIERAPWTAFIAMSLAAFAAGVWWLRRRAVPVLESVGFPLLICVTLPFLIYMPVLRINALTDGSPVHESTYRLAADRSLTPLEPGLPVLRFPDYEAYFVMQKVGSEQSFVLRRGWLGFWQVQRGDFSRRLKIFYDSQR